MRTLAILASVVIVAASSTACSSANAASDVGPSSLALTESTSGGPGVLVANAAGGQGKGKGGPAAGSGAISTLDYVMATDNNTNGLPDRGDAIAFVVSTSEQWNQISLVCSQSGDVVLSGVITSSAWNPVTLASAAWQSGTIDCVATLDQFAGAKMITLASKSFQAFAE